MRRLTMLSDRLSRQRSLILIAGLIIAVSDADAVAQELEYEVEVHTARQHDDGKFLWFHPRVTAVPALGPDQKPFVLMTIQKHLKASDYYSGLYTMRTVEDNSWHGPFEEDALAWTSAEDGVTVAVCDVTPGWHTPSQKVLAIGQQVRYGANGRQLYDVPFSNCAAYAVFDPASKDWSKWRRVEVPRRPEFEFVSPGCAQWIVEPDGSILLPVYFRRREQDRFSVAVFRCAFDGLTLSYVSHGNFLTLNEGRGIYEPSLVHFDGKYYLTIRSDERGYVAVSDDGLHFDELQPWTFDDGTELGSYNTQQHWVAHSDALFLVYTRRGANNDHISRHRAPLFMAQVNLAKMRITRRSEIVLIPERGATLGNFGVATIDAKESWVTVAEGVWNDDARKRGAKGAVFVARIKWSRANQLFSK